MNLSDFDYPVSQKQIAQYPLPDRDSSRLFVIRRDLNRFEHRIFRDISGYFRSGDVLVLNDTRVIPARICGTKPSGGRVELLLLRELGINMWEALVRGIKEGKVIITDEITAHVTRARGAPAGVRFEFENEGAGLRPSSTADIKSSLNEIGGMPLPPYIRRDSVESDRTRYQTVFASRDGAVAAPTAGLHFTERLLNDLRAKQLDIRTITLHVGYGTFRPVTVSDITDHRMGEEFYEIPETAAEAINRAKSEGRRVIAVGTTVTRTLEAAACTNYLKNLPESLFAKEGLNELHPLKKGGKGGFSEQSQHQINSGPGKASIFIHPGYKFKIIDALVTNFHQPKSTPMMLTAAFAGLDLLKHAYSEAQETGYRFFSYGDAMLIL
ncbi:MAG: tRNA preQ1(34) S-adenosylmethionine ribosyltransferase-isomerase QueA [Nitrospirae bacterium]|nr:tRNA preQ1(34) S-adenosylmethionine ribosyltransferase-isomerase QueA [Nitrospirota bacterium]